MNKQKTLFLVENLIKQTLLGENQKLAKQNYLEKNLITQDEYNKLVGIDPTPQKKYVFWLSKMFVNSGKKVSIDALRNGIEEYDTLLNKNQIPREQKNILDFKTFEDFQTFMHSMNQRETASLKELEHDYEIIVDTPELFIACPHSHEASRKLGLTYFAHRTDSTNPDSAWCTTFKTATHFNDYYLKQKHTFYYILVRDPKPTAPGIVKKPSAHLTIKEKLIKAFGKERAHALSKVAFAVNETGDIDAYDADDVSINSTDVTKYRKIIGK